MKQTIKQLIKQFFAQRGFEIRRLNTTVGSAEEVTLLTQEDFAAREAFRPNYYQLCDALEILCEFNTVLDLGSANGFIIDRFTAKGKTVTGIELSEQVLPYLSATAKAQTTFSDITTIEKQGEFDLVTCIEVAEHIPPAKSDALLDTIALHAKRYVYFTAATPYQGGVGHINCRPHFFWLNGFKQRGLDLDFEKTAQMIHSIHSLYPCTWLPLNSLIFCKR